MVLSDNEIRTALANGDIIIDPPPAQITTTTALDLTLGDEIKRWKPIAGTGLNRVVDPSADEFDFDELAALQTEDVPRESDGSIVLEPGQFVLGITHERIELPTRARIAARVEGRSTLARLGIGIHLTAPTIHSGFRGKITLEITNQGTLPVKLKPGLRICQLIFEQVFGTPASEMKGPFQDQVSIRGGEEKGL
jgi:dCTP deaminase